MIRPLGPFTVRPLRAAIAPRRQSTTLCAATLCADKTVSITPARRPIKATPARMSPELRIVAKP